MSGRDYEKKQGKEQFKRETEKLFMRTEGTENKVTSTGGSRKVT